MNEDLDGANPKRLSSDQLLLLLEYERYHLLYLLDPARASALTYLEYHALLMLPHLHFWEHVVAWQEVLSGSGWNYGHHRDEELFNAVLDERGKADIDDFDGCPPDAPPDALRMTYDVEEE